MTNKKWKDVSGREEYQLSDKMFALGFKPDFHEKDIQYKRVTPDNPPVHSTLQFKKETRLGMFYVWPVRAGWRTATVIGGLFSNHRTVESIEQLIENYTDYLPPENELGVNK